MKRSERGSQTVEMALCLLPFLGILFLTFSVAYAIYAKATLQHAVAEGVRYAITSQVMPGKGQDDSIKTVVQSSANGLLAGDNIDKVKIQYYLIDSKTGELTATESNLGGNVVEVSVEGVSMGPLTPILSWGKDGSNQSNKNPISLTVRASDRMEGSPGGVAPTR